LFITDRVASQPSHPILSEPSILIHPLFSIDYHTPFSCILSKMAPLALSSAALSLLLTISSVSVSAIPVTYSLERDQSECLFAPLRMNELLTTSIFVSGGEELIARTRLQGPIAPLAVSSSAEVMAASMRLDKLSTDKKNLAIDRQEELDFENLYEDDAYMDDDYMDDDYYDEIDDKALMAELDDDMDDVAFKDYYYMDDDDEYMFMEDDGMDDMEISEVRKLKEERMAENPQERMKAQAAKRESKDAQMKNMKEKRDENRRKKIAEIKNNKKRAKAEQRSKERAKKREHAHLEEGDPVEKTFMAEEEGWYRFCAEASRVAVEVEFELRQSSELGKPNKKTGHVQTYERHDMVRHEKKLMESLSRATKDKNVESGVKPEDLEKTKNAIAKMNRLLNEIREKQVNERHRLSIHKAVNEHSHSRMVVGSLLETVFYIAVSGFQVYTIRKWFSGNSLLGY